MILRPRQVEFKDRCVAALNERGNTLGVAPTGAGKSIMLAAVTAAVIGEHGKATVIAHRDELTDQNRAKFRRVNPGISTGVFDASTKQTDRQVTFGMIQTLARDKNLDVIKWNPPDLIVCDESHHISAGSYLKYVEACKEANPAVKVLGVTATPERGDGKSLRKVFNNIADQISFGELIREGHLVPPRTFVIDIGTQEALRKVKKTAQDFDMSAVAAIADKTPLNERVAEEWRKVAGDRKTIVFASTIEHARHLADAFSALGVEAAVVSGETPSAERAATLRSLDSGVLRVCINCAVLTEGFDSQVVSCVVLTRPSSHKSTMIQMIGRGLRTVDPEIHPGVIKSDCLVLDFGISVLTHGSMEQIATLGDGQLRKPGEAPTKECPECQALVPMGSFNCGLCGYEFIATEKEGFENEKLIDFVLTEVDILNASPFRWEEIFDGVCMVATAFEAWAVALLFRGSWFGLGGSKDTGVRVVARGQRVLCLSACDDYLRAHGDASGAKKSKSWLKQPASLKQLEHLNIGPSEFGMNRYRAACFLSFKFNERLIKYKVQKHENP